VPHTYYVAGTWVTRCMSVSTSNVAEATLIRIQMRDCIKGGYADSKEFFAVELARSESMDHDSSQPRF
jgi:hypothetical protein